MIKRGEKLCPLCGGMLKRYDKIKRIIRVKGGGKKAVFITRYICSECLKIHRELPERLLPYRQYTKEMIFAVVDGIITEETLGYEDYPCGMTMKRWREAYSISDEVVFAKNK